MTLPPASPGSSSSAESHLSYSPRLRPDLGLDPSDPLNLLIHSGNSSMDSSSQEGASPPDWTQISSLWPDINDYQTKPYTDTAMDFSDLASLSMDVDFNGAIAIEPSALHFNPMMHPNFSSHYSYEPQTPLYTDDLLAAQFPFTFQAHSPSDSTSSSSASVQSYSSGRRLSVGSSVSSSGASLSPAPEPISPVPAKQTVFSQDSIAFTHTTSDALASDPAAALAERVRQLAGVTLALPMSAQVQALEAHSQQRAPSTPATMPKLPIPRLNRPSAQTTPTTSNPPSTTSSAASTPPPSTPSPPPSTAPTRPKTSHTTIERRYRTNLNARIQSLRMAVPALRVVEDREGGKKRAPNKVLVSSDPLKSGNGSGVSPGEVAVVSASGVVDVIDERGFVDGVKVARKCSKANVLGKAVEYIRVLKRRELRLRKEQAGLKSLMEGLVGGPALIREWEREWKEMFGGEEKDEVEGEGEALDGDYDEDEDEDEDDEEEGGRKRKRGKVAAVGVKQEKKEKKTPSAPVAADGTAPEKRKRGRPRKVVSPPVTAFPTQDIKVDQDQAQGGAQQYLLATFALFSFVSSPLTSSSYSTSRDPSNVHAHTGRILYATKPAASTPASASVTAGSWGVTQYIQMFHLLVSLIVLVSFVSNWASKFGKFGFKPSSSSRSFFRLFSRSTKSEAGTLQQCVREAEECLFASESSNETSPTSLSVLSRVHIYRTISSHPSASLQELVTAILVLYTAPGVLGGLARMKAKAVWEALREKGKATRSQNKEYQKMVLAMDIDEAASRLASRDVIGGDDGEEETRKTPIQALASQLVKERIRGHLSVLFILGVCSSEEEAAALDQVEVEKENVERMKTVEAAKEIGGTAAVLGRRFERVWKVPGCSEDRLWVDEEQEEQSEEGDVEAEVEALLKSVVLYRRVFSRRTSTVGNGASSLISPPPSPGRKDTTDLGILRRALGNRVFETLSELEDARDRAVDGVVERERRETRRRGVGLE